MRASVQAHHVRRLVVETFEELATQPRDPGDLEENILIHEGRYAARSYRTDRLMAMWLIDVGLVQFYDADGNMLRTINLFEELEPAKMAA